MRAKLLLLALAALFCAASCKKKKAPLPSAAAADASVPASVPDLKPEEVAAICEGKAGVDRAPAYGKEAGKPSPAMLALKRTGDAHFGAPAAVFESDVLPGGVKPDAHGWFTNDATRSQLVVCGEITNVEKNGKVCDYQMPKTGDRKRIEHASAHVEWKVYETKTGKKVGEGKVDVPPDHGCSLHRDFSTRDPTVTVTRDLGTLWTWALASFEPADAPQPTVDVSDGWLACEGAGLVGAPPYDKASGAKNTYDAFRRSLDKSFFDDATEVFGGNLELSGFGKTPAVAVCESRTRGKKVKTCKFEGGKALTVYAATWTMHLAEAKSGAPIADKTFKEEKRPFCPASWNFDRDGDAMDLEPNVDKFVMPVLTPK